MTFVSFDVPGANTKLTLEEAKRLFSQTSLDIRIVAGATLSVSKDDGIELLDAIADGRHSSDAVGHLRAALMEYVHGPGAF